MASEQDKTLFGPNSYADYRARVEALQEEAKAYGVDIISVLVSGDPLNDTQTVCALWACGSIVALGASEYLRLEVTDNIRSYS